MLFDPKWKQDTKADPLAIGTLIAWLETMPADQEYCYDNTGHCMFAQYFGLNGFAEPCIGGFDFDHWTSGKLETVKFPTGWGRVASMCPHTYGAALCRARKLVS